MEHILETKLLGRSPMGAYLRLHEWIWTRLPASTARLRPVTAYGRLLHSLVRQRERRQYFGTFFLRNRPELELMGRLARGIGREKPRIAVLGCSIGTEAYSIMWAIRSRHPDSKVVMQAVDISSEAVAVAREGAYSRKVDELADEPVCQLMTDEEIRDMFDAAGGALRVKEWIREGIAWQVGDAGHPRILESLGAQDIVVANRFLCHMEPEHAERCLRNLARLVDPGGYLFVSGIDLDVRTKVARDLGWTPVRDLMEDIHDGDRTLRRSWPCRYWGLEPLDRGRPDWQVRYASVFQLG